MASDNSTRPGEGIAEKFNVRLGFFNVLCCEGIARRPPAEASSAPISLRGLRTISLSKQG
jgi:hypothetical protein